MHSIYIFCILVAHAQILQGCTASYVRENKAPTVEHIKIVIHIPEGSHVYADSLRVISGTDAYAINTWYTQEKPTLLYDAQRHVQTRCLQRTIHLTVEIEKKDTHTARAGDLWIAYTTNSDPSPACLRIPLDDHKKATPVTPVDTSIQKSMLPFSEEHFFKKTDVEKKELTDTTVDWCMLKKKYSVFFSFILFMLVAWHLFFVIYAYVYNQAGKKYYWTLLLRTYFLLMGMLSPALFMRSLFFTLGNIWGLYALTIQWTLSGAAFFIISFAYMTVDILLQLQQWYCT